jgi:predicted signal transduction protein with EAL and GGDEF domain
VNDTFGHRAGDELLCQVAHRLAALMTEHETIARFGGDEFVVLFDHAGPERIDEVVAAIDGVFAEPFTIEGEEVRIGVSVGVTIVDDQVTSVESLLSEADAAMYFAKARGGLGKRVVFFDELTRRNARTQVRIEADLAYAVERNELVVFYQPVVEVESGTPIGVEALMRWKHPQRGMVSPMEFIPVLEETGLIGPAGDWVLRRACEDLKRWQADGHAVVPVAVNLSARQFRRADLDTHILSLVAAAGIDPKLIELEITESQLMHDPQHAIRVMRALRDAGMTIAVDDFGTGYSSLAYLNRFPLNALKIDRSFIKDMATGKDHAVIARTIIEMAHSLGFTVVAEGVETEEQATFLRLLRCERAQGFLFAKPMPAAELARLLPRP